MVRRSLTEMQPSQWHTPLLPVLSTIATVFSVVLERSTTYLTYVHNVRICTSMRSAAHGDFAVPRSRTTRYRQRSFAVSGLILWNSLPLTVRGPSLSLSQFCARLKAFLFCKNIIIAPPWPSSPPSARQHPSYGDCLEVERQYYQNSSVLDCVTQCSQSAAHLCEQLTDWVCHIGTLTQWLEAVAWSCIIVT